MVAAEHLVRDRDRVRLRLRLREGWRVTVRVRGGG